MPFNRKSNMAYNFMHLPFIKLLNHYGNQSNLEKFRNFFSFKEKGAPGARSPPLPEYFLDKGQSGQVERGSFVKITPDCFKAR